MANITIPGLPAAISLNGTEEYLAVQSGSSVYVTTSQIASYINTNYPAPGVSRVSTSGPITGGPITSTGTITLQTASVTNAYLATMTAGTIKANVTGGTATPTDATPSSVLDLFGSTQGMTLYRGASGWAALAGSGTNTLLSLSGSTSNPAWQTLSYMIDNAINSASAQGTLLYRGASSWSALAPGISGQVFQTQGAGANPQWASVGSGTVTSVNASGGSTGLNFTGGPITSSGTLTMGGTLGTGYGGTNLTSFTSGGAVYATSTSALTTGILPVASGGTGSSSPSLVAGTNVTISGSWPNQTINASGGGGTVTSVNVSGGTTGLTTSGGPVTGFGTITLAGTLASANGGTGFTTYAAGDLIYASATNTLSKLTAGTNGYVLTLASGVPTWAASTGGVTSFSAGSTGLTPNTATTGAISLAGTLAVGYGGTGLTTFTSGGAVYATSTSALTTGTLPIASGGTNSTAAATAGGVGYGTGTAHAYTAAGTTGQVLTSNGAGAPTWATAGSTGVTSVAQTFTGGIVSVSGSPITTTGTLALTVAGTSGGIPYFSSGTTWATSAALTQYGVIYGGGAGAAPVSTAAGTAGYALIANSAAAPTFQQVSLTAGVTGTLPVANGGTGVTASTGANSVVLRDSNANITANYLFAGYSNTAAAGTTTTLTAASTFSYVVTGSGGQTFKLPDATTLSAGATYIFNNNQTSGTIVVQNNSATTVVTVQSGAVVYLTLLTNSVAAGTWDTHYQAPSNVSWSTNTFDYAGSITSATWNGVAVAANRGGTGVANNVASTLTISGSFGTTFTVTGTTSVTLPTSGTLATTSNTVASFSGGSTGLTPSSATTGAVSLAGTLIVGNGGTGATTLTGVLKGNGTSAFTAATAGTDYLAPPSGTAILKANSGGALANATAGTDYVAPGTATTFTATQTFNGSSSVLASVLVNAAETMTISATAATGTINYDVTTQSVLYYTSNASANWTVNFRASSGTSLNTAMSTGQSVTVAFLVTQGSTAYYNNVVQVDGTSVTPKYQGGTAWSAGNASSVDIYTYTIVKTGSAAFTVFASQTQFK
jgi:hypothetical protein